MALRFQKRIRILPGLWINLSKTGISFSAGGRGATINAGTQGRRSVTLGIPGTGLSYKMDLTAGIFVIILAIVAVFALLYFLAPGLVRPILHWWQPKIFPAT
jgi:formate hydrogenlyase subunit 3/multisubunit Na+/H+ antiporter MnhD subunit